MLHTAVISVSALLGGLIFCGFLGFLRKKSTPPGPTGLPIIGNAHQIPTGTPWITFSEMGKKFGDIIYFNVFGTPLIVINSTKIVKDLLDRRSNVYSDRPHFVMAGDLIGCDQSFALQPYGENWRKQRRLIAQDFSQSMIPRYHYLQEKEAAILAKNIMKEPNSLVEQIKLRIGVIIVRVTYGYYIQHSDDSMLTLPLKAMLNFSKATLLGNFLVDFMPLLQHLPRWAPGAGFLTLAEEWRKVLLDASQSPYKWCKTNLDTGGTLLPNLCANYLQAENGNMSIEEEENVMWASFTVMGGGMDTNMSSALSFFMAMILYPKVQVKAQEEIDRVIGNSRLPLIVDRPNLPYVRSIMAEIFRWAPPAPLGIAHATSEADVYEGYEIPKGALILPNIWHMLRDPAIFEHPDEFIPERFNGDEAEMARVNEITFGFGRRACPGKHFAEGTLFAIISTILATCNILPALDEQGNPVLPVPEYTASGIITFPKPYKLRITPRSSQAASLLAEVDCTVE